LPSPDGLDELNLDGVTLQYPGRNRPAVDGVSVTIRAGQTIALVGENGSGKSTLAAMIGGLREPTAGVLSWNGRPYQLWDRDGLRRHIGVALQDHHRWPFSAVTNIAMGDIDRTPLEMAAVEHAAAMAAAHDMILDLPHGYDTLLDRSFRDGQDLSGGQWQRITAARAFLRDPDLLIMDEPSSALDPRAEHALFQALRGRQGTKTILITHRLANITHADQILVLDQGRVSEAGTHQQLMTAGRAYAQLFTIQASGYTSA
jgi:ATP-binding cassette subfamily B protein